ncbi:Hypothetical predicted protein [Scomber scombrus]|uniref:Uncharacterized protein n=1 Tax=Scomber scombrus TaxID=13677 RepID=A0AAV1NBM0_SCOSC
MSSLIAHASSPVGLSDESRYDEDFYVSDMTEEVRGSKREMQSQDSSMENHVLLLYRDVLMCCALRRVSVAQDRTGRHAFRDALFHGVSFLSVSSVHRWTPVHNQDF